MKRKSIVTISFFILIIGTSYILWPFLKNYVNTGIQEKKELMPKPVLNISDVATFPKEYEAYINDHIPFRNQLVQMNSLIDYYIYHSSPADSVTIGEDGWLFYIEREDGDSLGCYRGENLLTEEQLRKIANNLIVSRNSLKEKGIDFVVFIAPNKERIYEEYMPWYYGEPADDYAALQIYNYIKENTDIKIVYPYLKLKEAKNNLGEDILLYHKTDTHWNELGGYIGASELLKEFDITIPSYDVKTLTIEERDDKPGDMARVMNVSTVIEPGKTYYLTGYNQHNIVEEKYDLPTYIRYRSEGSDPRKIFINRDSFCTAMSEIIGSQFESSVMIYRGIYTNNMVDEEKPDIYVLEMVERYAPEVLLDFTYE